MVQFNVVFHVYIMYIQELVCKTFNINDGGLIL